MKFTIARETLLKPLQVVGGVVEKRQTLPVLSNVLLQLTGSKLTLTGTDLEVELKATVELESDTSGEITLPARKFMDICRSLPEGAMLDIAVEDGRALIRSGRSRFTLSILPATEFPNTDVVKDAIRFEVKPSALKGLIDRTQFCMANQDVRYYLNGLLFEIGGGSLRAVATDGHRLAIADVESDVALNEKHQVIIPRKAVLELSKLLGDGGEISALAIGGNQIQVTNGDITLTSKLIDGRFPDYERVIPAKAEKVVIADREVLRQSLARASILSNEKYRGVRLALEQNRLRAVVNNPEQEEAEEEIEVQYSGAEFEIGFNVSYLVDALNAIHLDEVEMSMNDPNSSCLLQGIGDSSSRYVIMPMRL